MPALSETQDLCCYGLVSTSHSGVRINELRINSLVCVSRADALCHTSDLFKSMLSYVLLVILNLLSGFNFFQLSAFLNLICATNLK